MAVRKYNKHIKVSGNMMEFFDALRKSLKHPMTRDVGTQIASYTSSVIQKNFADKRDSRGNPWKELAPRTLRERRKQHVDHDQPLVRTGELFESATKGLKLRISMGGKGLALRAGFRSALGRKKFAMHNRPTSDVFVMRKREGNEDLGGFDKGGGIEIPGREFFYLTREAWDIIETTVMMSILEGATRMSRQSADKAAHKYHKVKNYKSSADVLKRATNKSMSFSFRRGEAGSMQG